MSYSDKAFYQLTISISKALSSAEFPLKVKHARAAIIGTFHSGGAHSFWAIAVRQPLQENRITAWKFCHLLHKVLREGHPLACQHSMRQRGMLTELGKLWGHLKDGYGACIKQYTKLLVTKLEFHDRNPRFPGSMSLKKGELEQIGGNDINYYFHLAVEMFDYLDEIIALQDTIFKSLTMFHVNSMTPAGQCRVAPLIPCIQDSSPLYDFLVRIMFKLHSNLPSELLIGHRERFRTAFGQLSKFYEESRSLQYFVSLITVPQLPANAPNFSSQVDFGEYQAPVVVIPEQEAEPEVDEFVDNLVDMSMQQQQQQQHVPVQPPPQPSVDFEKLIIERDDLIRHLQMEVDRLGRSVKSGSVENRELQTRFEEQMASMHSELSQVQEEMELLKMQKEELELAAQSAPTLEQKAIAEEERAKASEEKFHKLKSMYSQIRDEHVKLLRTHGEVSKQLVSSTKIVSEMTKEKEDLRCQLEDFQHQQAKVEENLQQSSSEARRENEEMQVKLKEIQEKFEDLEANKSAEIAELRIKCDNLSREIDEAKNANEELSATRDSLVSDRESLATEVESLKEAHNGEVTGLREEIAVLQSRVERNSKESGEVQEDLERQVKSLQDERQDLEAKLSELKVEKETEVEVLNCKYEEEVKKAEEVKSELEGKIQMVEEEREALKSEKSDLCQQLEALQEDLRAKSDEMQQLQVSLEDQLSEARAEVDGLRGNLEEMKAKHEILVQNYDRLAVDKSDIECELQDLLHQQTELEEKHTATLQTVGNLEAALKDAQIHGEVVVRALLEACIKSSESLATRTMTEEEFGGGAAGSPAYFGLMAEELTDVLTKLGISHQQYVADNASVEPFARKIIMAGHLMATVQIQGVIVCNSTSDIECGEQIAEDLREWYNKHHLRLFESLLATGSTDGATACLEEVKTHLQTIAERIGALSKKLDPTENIGDMFETELASMDKAIEEAAQRIEDMLSESRASDSGVKLEVNEKILDACTTLMRAIRVLVQKSRLVQGEIVAVGKGTASAKEFYKRNHQWTEGLISAAKAVAQGANFLVTAANKAVSGDAKHQLDLVVAAQEIAASTTQLVVASRVKAPRGSSNLAALGSASKGVTQSTAAVVATAKDCTKRLEDSQDLDLENLTVHQAKRMEMELKVRVLELEQSLQSERLMLAAFRRKNYQSGEDGKE
ncbi:huntingtin-interacting protein 1 isoform X2 [Phlebotomus argentipes]|uniref:huntingtin-interacting protein 1 isoform X2 n=1 Tax=Phlebotomus argentipes TaxID=94469 RepID=UPI0028937F57|nr:huntingtin-interacting protein 1 isoform X2 [Phlebotomus argentipes]XP_059609110.1 huntingtin-interacting protein 1 isoform X2 [Phlebotomus argentipes]